MAAPDQVEIDIIRGDIYEVDVRLDPTWAEVIESPELYVGKLVFRETQDDDETALLTLTADPEIEELVTCGVAADVAYLHFEATPAQTQELPERRCFAYAEIRTLTGLDVRRLFNGKVVLRD